MEVHHHAHSGPDNHRGLRKKWTHYFWEFLMLFLAVFCGFLAENEREHIIEKHRAKDFAKALYSDVVNDTLPLKIIQYDFADYSLYLDTLFETISSQASENLSGGEVYYYAVMGLKNRQFSPTDATLQQLLNSGSLRYFKNLDLVKTISEYSQALRSTERTEETSMTILMELRKLQTKIFNFKIYSKMNNWSLQNKMDCLLVYKKKNLPVISSDRQLLAEFANWANLRRANNSGGRVRQYLSTLEISRTLIKKLKAKYHFN